MNKYEKKLKAERRLKRKNRKKYGWMFRLMFSILAIISLGFTVILAVKNFGIALTYMVNVFFVFLGIIGVIGLALVKRSDVKANLATLLFLLIGLSAFTRTCHMTMDLTGYVFLDKYETQVVTIEEIHSVKGLKKVITDLGTFDFHFSTVDAPDGSVVALDYLPKSHLGLKIRQITP
ncbi:MAG: hypothetical protein JXO44_02600 [Clostridia bacterium]|nr:hypothetical protein [Clostridia bacterium]